MGRKYVLDGAIVQCSMGMKPAKLMVITNQRVKIQGKFKATDTDLLVPETFLQCKLKPTPGGFLPCIPILQKWQNTSKKTNLRGIQKFLFDDSYTMCMPGSRITILNPMQINAAGAAFEQYKNISTTIPGAMPLQGFDEGTLPVEKEGNSFLDSFQTVLDIAGLVPGFGEIADGINAAIYVARGDYANAALSAAAMIPIGGQAATAAKLGKKAKKAAETVAEKRKIATDFYKKHNPDLSDRQIRSHINGIDFTKPVKKVKIPPDGSGKKGNELYQFTKANSEGKVFKGQYYTDNPKNTPSELGVSDKYGIRDADGKTTGEIGTVKQEKIIFDENKSVEGLKSTSKEINDTWSIKGETIPTKGGGSQIYVPKGQ